MKGVKTEIRFRPRPANVFRRPAVRMAAVCAAKFAAAFLLCGGEIFGACRPFAVAFVTAAGAGLSGFFALLGAAAGYTAYMGFYAGLRYSAAALIVFFIAFVLFEKPAAKCEAFAPITAGISSFLLGVAFLLGGLSKSNWVWLISETVLTASCAYFFALALKSDGRVRKEGRDMRRAASLLILLATLLITLAPFKLIANISVGRLLATLTVMAAAYTGGVGAGSAVGTITGLAMDVAAAELPLFTMAYAFSGLLAGIFKSQGRLSFTIAYILSNAAAVFWTQAGAMRTAILYEVFVASVLFMLLPQRSLSAFAELTDLRGEADVRNRAGELLRRRLERMASAFTDLRDALRGSFSPRGNDNDIATVFDRAADRVCRKCVLVNLCWQKEYENTKNALNDVTPRLRQRGSVEREDYPTYFSGRCLKLGDFTDALNAEYTALLRRRQQFSRAGQSREIICGQYAELAAALRRAAQEMSEELSCDEYAERRVSQYLSGEGVSAKVSVYRDHTGRLRAEVEGGDLGGIMDKNVREKFSELLRVPVGEPERIKSSTGQRLLLAQSEPLAAIAGGASRSREGQNVSGDSATYFKSEDGVLCLILSDGMGSGAEADRESGFTVRLLEKFLRAGMEPKAALKTMNSALLLGDEHVVAAVDLLTVDLFTGEAGIFKYGAAPTYIKRGRTIRRMDGRAMAAGSGVDSGEPDTMRIELEPNDFVVMLSDGVSDGREDDWLRETLAAYEGESPSELSASLISGAAEQGGAVDDMTVMSLRIINRES